jgi:hypothetical protein
VQLLQAPAVPPLAPAPNAGLPGPLQPQRHILSPGFASRRSPQTAGEPIGPTGPNVENEHGIVPSGVPVALLADDDEGYDQAYLIVHRPDRHE